MGEVETFATTLRPTLNLIDDNRYFALDEGGKNHGTVATCEMIDNLRSFFNKNNVKALMSMVHGKEPPTKGGEHGLQEHIP